MRYGLAGSAAFATLMTLALPAMAQESTGYHVIAAGDLVAAEHMLIAERRIFPTHPELMLNLATVYARTGRAAQARTLYETTLSTAPVDLDMPNGAVVSSHAMAQMGLTKLFGALVATR